MAEQSFGSQRRDPSYKTQAPSKASYSGLILENVVSPEGEDKQRQAQCCSWDYTDTRARPNGLVHTQIHKPLWRRAWGLTASSHKPRIWTMPAG